MTSPILEKVREAYAVSIAEAGEHMGKMLGKQLDVRARRIGYVPFDRLYEGLAPPETPMAMLVMRIAGEGDGFILFVMFEEAAKRLNEHLWEGVPFEDTVVDLSNMSALKELANVSGTAFLNRLAKIADLELRPSEPYMMYDMVASVLEMVIAENAPLSDEVILIDSDLIDPSLRLSMHFLFLPSPDMAARLQERLG